MTQTYRLNNFDITQVGPRVDERYPIYRSGRTSPAIDTGDSWDEWRNTFAGGVLNGFQNIPRAQRQYADLVGTAEHQAANPGVDLAGLMGNIQTNSTPQDPAQPISGVVATQPTDTWTASPVDDGSTALAPGGGGTGLTNAEYLQMMGVPVEFFSGGQPGVQALSKNQADDWNSVMSGYGFDPNTRGSAVTSWADFAAADAGDRSQAQKILDIYRQNERGNMYENDPRLTANGMRMGG